MGDKGDDIFSDDFASKKSDEKQEQSEFKLPKEDEVHDVSIGSEPPKEPKKDSSDKDWEIPDKQEPPKPSRKKAGIIGAVVVIGVMIGIVYASGIITTDGVLDDIELGVPVPDQPADDVRIVDGKKPEKPKDEPFKDFSSASDKVIIEKTKDPIGYYMVTTNDDWYGDFVDIRKIPSKIEKSGNLKINFRCYTDDFQGTSTYFATFRNVIDNNLTVEVYINGLEVESQSTTTNKALILEGSCYGHES